LVRSTDTSTETIQVVTCAEIQCGSEDRADVVSVPLSGWVSKNGQRMINDFRRVFKLGCGITELHRRHLDVVRPIGLSANDIL
jgi:hypothetical protein